MVNLKCDETCKGGDNCTNSRIYISGLPKGCTADDITDMFGGLGTIARERPQGRGVFPDMMPYRVKFYGNDDCLLHYEDPHAAHAAPSFFDGQELKGSKLHVEMAEKKPNQGLPAGYYIPPEAKGQSCGGEASDSDEDGGASRKRGFDEADQERLVVGDDFGEQGHDEEHQEDPEGYEAPAVALEVLDTPARDWRDPHPEELLGLQGLFGRGGMGRSIDHG